MDFRGWHGIYSSSKNSYIAETRLRRTLLFGFFQRKIHKQSSDIYLLEHVQVILLQNQKKKEK